MPTKEPINVNIRNIIAWFKESEQCLLFNHAERIPNSLDSGVDNFLAGGNDSELLRNPIETNKLVLFAEWIRTGIDNGFCHEPLCLNHDPLPSTVEEDDDDDPCVIVTRIYVPI